MLLPEDVRLLLSRLQSAGYTAYAVGGCVRDTLLGAEPKDWDLCTSALPDQMLDLFREERLVTNGLKHGTVTVILHHTPYEITTYRVDGAYSDQRHPDSVSFVDRIDQDLARRDFTINAMACAPDGSILDLFGGREDLAARVIRCVGDPDTRFGEDALRVLRALRFASVLDFQIDPATDAAVRRHYPDLEKVAAERIRVELVKTLCGAGAGRILRAYPEVFTFLLPCLKDSVGYNQDNPHHLYTVWEHSIRALEEVPPDPVLRMTMLLHDCGKPAARTTDESGVGHYKKHQVLSARMAHDALENLRFDKAGAERIELLVANHDIPITADRKILLRRLSKFGEENLRSLLLIHRADRIATGTQPREEAERHYLNRTAALDALLAERPCYTLKDLKVNGRDVAALGYRGKEIGETLDRLLRAVIDETLPNDRDALLEAARPENAQHPKQTADHTADTKTPED